VAIDRVSASLNLDQPFDAAPDDDDAGTAPFASDTKLK